MCVSMSSAEDQAPTGYQSGFTIRASTAVRRYSPDPAGNRMVFTGVGAPDRQPDRAALLENTQRVFRSPPARAHADLVHGRDEGVCRAAR